MVRAALLAIVLAALTTTPANANTTRPPVLLIGDSITCRGADPLHQLKPLWQVDCVPGREVDRLSPRIRYWLSEYGAPRHVVMALGTNEVPDWTRGDYAAAVDILPTTTTVWFITTYRDPTVFGEDRALTQRTYSWWMNRIAANRPNVHTIPYRNAAAGGAIPLADGVHPTTPEGTQAWADLVVTTITGTQP